jgi:hypothetical protein
MRALDVRHCPCVQIQPLLAEDGVPAPADEEINDDKNPDGDVIDFIVHKFLQFYAVNLASIKVGFGERECVPYQLKAGFRVIRYNDFHNIESEKNVGIVEHSQPGQGAARNSLLLFSIDRCPWPAEIFACARFYFDKYQCVIVTTDDIDFTAAATAEIAQQDFVTATPQIAAR